MGEIGLLVFKLDPNAASHSNVKDCLGKKMLFFEFQRESLKKSVTTLLVISACISSKDSLLNSRKTLRNSPL